MTAVATAFFERTCHICDAVNLFVYKLYIKAKWSRELRRNHIAFENLLQKYDSEAGYHLTRMNEATNKKYQEKLNATKLKPFKWGWEDNGED